MKGTLGEDPVLFILFDNEIEKKRNEYGFQWLSLCRDSEAAA